MNHVHQCELDGMPVEVEFDYDPPLAPLVYGGEVIAPAERGTVGLISIWIDPWQDRNRAYAVDPECFSAEQIEAWRAQCLAAVEGD